MRVAVLAGGRSSEHEVSLSSAAFVRDAVAAAGHDVLPVTIERDGAWVHDGEPLALRPGAGLAGADAVFPVLHGPFGEDGTVQGVLALLDVPYVGAGVLASALCMDKIVFKELLAAAGVPQVRYAGVREPEWRSLPEAVRARLGDLGLPVFVKPARLGSSVGIVKVETAGALDAALDTAFGHDGRVIVEGFSGGTEVECSVIGILTFGGRRVTSKAIHPYQLEGSIGGMHLPSWKQIILPALRYRALPIPRSRSPDAPRPLYPVPPEAPHPRNRIPARYLTPLPPC